MPEQNNTNTESSPITKENVSALIRDPEIRSLKVGSDEFNAAVGKKLSAKNEKKTEESATTADVINKDDELETDDEANEVEESTELEDRDQGKKSKNGIDKKFKALTKAKKDALREAEEARAELAELKKTLGEKDGKAAPVKEESEPTVDDFESIGDFVKAHSAWTIKQYEASKNAQQTQKEAQASYQKMVGEFQKRGKALETELGLEAGEFGVIVGDEDFTLYEGTQHILLNSEHGARVAYEIANDDDLKKKVIAMAPVQQVAFVAKLEAKYEAKSDVAKPSTKEKTKVSNAKKPAKAIVGGGGSAVTGGSMPNPKTDFKAWKAWREEQKNS